MAWVVVVTLLAVPLVFRAQVEVGPGTVRAGVQPAWRGATTLELPPLGSITARTHRAPAQVDLELREVDLVEAIDTPARPDVTTAADARPVIEAAIRKDLPEAFARLGLTLAGTAALCGMLAAAAFPGRRSPRRLVAGAATGTLAVAVLVAPIAIGFDPDAFVREPELSGQLGSAEELVARVGSLQTPFGSVESRTRVLSERLAGLYSSALTDQIAASEGQVVLLHVSDLHLNAVGLALTRDLARSFEVDAVVDTGDITSFGFEPEASFIDLLGGFEVPYYVVAGNHDSEQVRRRLAASDDVVLLDDEAVEIRGVRVLGIGDPTVTALRTIPRDELDRTYREQFPTTRRLIAAEQPDLLLVHNPVQARPAIGDVPVIAAGHLHRSELEIVDDSVLAVVGSSGATGVGNLLLDDDAPYRFQLLRFVDGDLVAVDQIELRGAGGDLRIDRRLIRRDEPSAGESDLVDERVEEPARDQFDPDELARVTSTTANSPNPTTARPRPAASTTTTTTTSRPGG